MTIQKIKLPNGQTFNIEEWLHWPVYSTVEAAAGTSVNLAAFSYVVGQNVPRTGLPARQATYSDTNQVARSRMNHDEAMIVFSMTYEHFAVEGTAHANSQFVVPPLDMEALAPVLSGLNLAKLRMDLMINLLIGAGITKPMASAPLSYFGQGIGAAAWGSGDALAIATAGATALNLNYGTGGYLGPKNQRLWSLPVMIESDRVMKCQVQSPAGVIGGSNPVDQDWSLKIYLDGLKKRPVA
jgi:hypothetical protein